MNTMTRVRRLLASALAAVIVSTAGSHVVRAADPVPPFIPAAADWLTTVNYYRAMAGLSPVVENTTWNAGAYNHSCYMLYNGIAHDEIPGKPGYTVDGDNAGNRGNVAVSSVYGQSARNHIELWMTGPFHALGILRHNLYAAGFGKCDLTSSPTSWRSGATLNVLDGLVSKPRPTTPIVWPGNGTTTNLNKFITESPNPLDYCGWTGGAGLPVIAMMPEPVASATATFVGPAGPIPSCALHGNNTTSTASAILKADNAVTVLPRYELSAGTYTVTITTNVRTVTWSFTVDPTAATGVMPVPNVQPSGAASAFEPMTPFRFADSRTNMRIGPVLAGSIKKVKVSGTGWIPSDATAISANFTAINSVVGTSSYLTVFNCSTAVPTAATLNLYPGQAVGNAGIVPLSTDGYLCFYSPVQTDLIIDVNGFYRASSATRYTAITPTPLIDTDRALNVRGRLGDAEITRNNVRTAGVGVPSDATAVALIFTGKNPAANSYVTAYPCDQPQPSVANVNPIFNTVRSNFGFVPLAANGELCVFNLRSVDLKVDVIGYFTTSGSGTFVPATPTRVTDTRDQYRTLMNLGTNGQRMAPGATLTLDLQGERGIPSTAKALSLNVTVVAPTTAGAITVRACGATTPTNSISFEANRTTPSGMQVAFSSAGTICITTTASIHLVIDVTGWWN